MIFGFGFDCDDEDFIADAFRFLSELGVASVSAFGVFVDDWCDADIIVALVSAVNVYAGEAVTFDVGVTCRR